MKFIVSSCVSGVSSPEHDLLKHFVHIASVTSGPLLRYVVCIQHQMAPFFEVSLRGK